MGSTHQPTRWHKKSPSSSSSWSETSCALSKYIAERWEKLSRTERQSVPSGPILFTKGRQSIDASRPAWARQHRIRRGIDHPFAKPVPSTCKVPHVVLAPPPRIRSRHLVPAGDSHFVEVSQQLEVTRTCSYILSPRTPTVFPRGTGNPDLPILRPGLSEWIRAQEPIPSP